MLGRTRPASQILLWPRSKTRPVRFTTTASTRSDHEAAADYESEDVRNHVHSSAPEKRRFRGIRKLVSGLKDPAALWAETYTIRRVSRNTAPAVPQEPRAKVEKTLGDSETGHGITQDDWPPRRQDGAENDANNMAEELSSPPERGLRRANRLTTFSPRSRRVADVPKIEGPSGPWKPYSPHPDLVTRKPSSPVHGPAPTPPNISSTPKKDYSKVDSDGDAPLRSKILGELKAWNLDTPLTTSEQPTKTPEPPSQSPDTVPEHDGPLRSEIIEEMEAWNYVPPVNETDADQAQQPVSQPPLTPRVKTPEELPPLDREFREWLKTATEKATREAELDRHLTKGVDVYDGPTVLVLNAASRTLLESDFYRLAPQGKHLGDWAVGIARIIQARDPATYEPMGKYYIFFHTRAAAMAYSEEVWRLHRLSRKAAQLISTSLSSSTDSSIPGPFPLTPTLAAESADLDAALRGYTLLPHSAMLDLKLHLCKDLALPETDKLSDMNRYLGSSPKSDPAQDHYFVLVSLEGCKSTIAALHDAITRDGEERRLPWALATRPQGKMCIAAVVLHPAPEAEITGNDRDGRRFWRFIIPFVEAAEARRFVRNWHRREMRDLEGRDMVVTFNVTALW